MDFTDAARQAREVRSAFAAFERASYGREWTLSDIVAGLATDVGDLSRLVAAKQGLRPEIEDVEAKLGHELADVLWCLFVIADAVEVDLESAFETTMVDLKRWLSEH